MNRYRDKRKTSITIRSIGNNFSITVIVNKNLLDFVIDDNIQESIFEINRSLELLKNNKIARKWLRKFLCTVTIQDRYNNKIINEFITNSGDFIYDN